MDGTRVAGDAAVDVVEIGLPGDFVGACVLLLLQDRWAYTTQDLRERLAEVGLREDEVGPAEDILGSLEFAGLVRAITAVDRSTAYRLTPRGDEQLQIALDDLCGAQVHIGRFLARCEKRCLRALPPLS